jgi:hypothetical protein
MVEVLAEVETKEDVKAAIDKARQMSLGWRLDPDFFTIFEWFH